MGVTDEQHRGLGSKKNVTKGVKRMFSLLFDLDRHTGIKFNK